MTASRKIPPEYGGYVVTVTVCKIGMPAYNYLKMTKGRRAHGPDRARGCAACRIMSASVVIAASRCSSEPRIISFTAV
jgi:hypothetical protein